MTLNDYMQKCGDDVMADLQDTIDGLYVPASVKNRLCAILDDNEFDIMEHNYEILRSDYEDMAYEQYKEERMM